MKTPGTSHPSRPTPAKAKRRRHTVLAAVTIAAAVFAAWAIPAESPLPRVLVVDAAIVLISAITLDAIVACLAGLGGYLALQTLLIEGAFTGNHPDADIWRLTSVIVALGIGFLAGAAYRLQSHRGF